MSHDDAEGASNAVALPVVCFFDSFAEMRGFVGELHCELDVEQVGLLVEIDKALECSLTLYPLIGGQPFPDAGIGADTPLFQLSDDGLGWVSPECLWRVVEILIEDLMPAVTTDNRVDIFERFAGGDRPLALVDTSGRPLADADCGAGTW